MTTYTVIPNHAARTKFGNIEPCGLWLITNSDNRKAVDHALQVITHDAGYKAGLLIDDELSTPGQLLQNLKFVLAHMLPYSMLILCIDSKLEKWSQVQPALAELTAYISNISVVVLCSYETENFDDQAQIEISPAFTNTTATAVILPADYLVTFVSLTASIYGRHDGSVQLDVMKIIAAASSRQKMDIFRLVFDQENVEHQLPKLINQNALLKEKLIGAKWRFMRLVSAESSTRDRQNIAEYISEYMDRHFFRKPCHSYVFHTLDPLHSNTTFRLEVILFQDPAAIDF